MKLRLDLFTCSFSFVSLESTGIRLKYLLLGLLQTIGSPTSTLLLESEKICAEIFEDLCILLAIRSLSYEILFYAAILSLINPEHNVSTQMENNSRRTRLKNSSESDVSKSLLSTRDEANIYLGNAAKRY